MEKTKLDEVVSVRSSLPTLPLPPHSKRPPVTTNRLLIRALQPTDVDALHILRTQPEVMKWTSSGTIDKDIEATREKLELFLPPNDAATFNCAICLKDTCEVVGMGGCHLFPAGHGWPEVGYMLRKEFWGGGLATEFLRAWLRLWGGLPREEREVRAEKAMVTGEGVVPEQVIAITEASNGASQKVLLRVGFQRLREFIEADDSEPDGFVKLVAFRYFPSKRDD